MFVTELPKPIQVLQINHPKPLYIPIDVSVDSPYFTPGMSALAFEEVVEQYLQSAHAQVAYGGYLEVRNLYQRSDVFQQPNTEARNIHLGLDLWTKAGTPVLAAWDGVIHSFQDNRALGDYGPTIILKHTFSEITFYTLYGHLHRGSLTFLQIGQKVQAGDVIASLGTAEENGDYAPHLHFQIILNLQGKSGDYPGVCAASEVDFYKANCPDPVPFFAF
jgi:murein DD-endopeptidase MepM/ murein hydrolase activator NlpD